MSLVSKADGKTDVRVLGSQPGLSPHSPEGEEEPGKDVRDPRHQTVRESEDLITRDLSLPLAQRHLHWPMKEGGERL